MDTAAALFSSSCHGDTQVRVRNCAADSNCVRGGVCRSCQTCRRCLRGLLSTTRLLEGMLSSPEKQTAKVLHHAPHLLSWLVCCAPLSRWCSGRGSVCGDSAAPLLGVSCHSATHVQVHKCTLSNNCIRGGNCRSCQTPRGCWYGLLSSKRASEGVLSIPEKSVAALRQHAAFLSPSLVSCPGAGRQ